jgi:hypothetical protein
MAGQSRPKDSVLSHAYVPVIHVCMQKVVAARDKRGHDDLEAIQSLNYPYAAARMRVDAGASG